MSPSKTSKTGSTRRNVVWGMSTLSALVLAFGYHTSTNTAEATTATGTTETSTASSTSPTTTSGTSSSTTLGTTSGSGSTTRGSSAGSSSSTSSSGSTASSSSGSTATSTTVTGQAAQTRYGPVQVQLTVADGKVTAVDVVEYPSSNGKDQQINARALPILVSETLAAQSSQIDMVSGATYTSDGYVTSLQSALDEAGLS